MRKRKANLRPENPKAPSPDQVEELFRTVDETGHSNPAEADAERKRRSEGRQGVEVDPLDPSSDPSGSRIEHVLNRTAAIFVSVLFGIVLLSQLSCSVGRHVTTTSLSEEVTVSSVSQALRIGVEWGNGYTQFPDEFVVKEADENTGRVEVTVNSTESSDVLTVFSNSQIQSAALSINALLNPNIDTVIYHVNVYVDSNGNIEQSRLFGLLQPTGQLQSFMTFVWTKQSTDSGVSFSCTITDVDEDTAEELRDKLSGTTIFPSTEEDGDQATTDEVATDEASTDEAATDASTDASGTVDSAS
jgi:hypothetical protein